MRSDFQSRKRLQHRVRRHLQMTDIGRTQLKHNFRIAGAERAESEITDSLNNDTGMLPTQTVRLGQTILVAIGLRLRLCLRLRCSGIWVFPWPSQAICLGPQREGRA